MANENLKNLEMLKSLVGSSLWKQIVNLFGGGCLYIPSREDFNRDERNKQIKADYHNGGTDEELALKYDLSIDRIRVIRNMR